MQTNDEILWHIAKRRAAFKKQLASYVCINAFLWAAWFLLGRYSHPFNTYPWPVWVMFWWGVGLGFSFVNAYVINTKEAIRNEYQKLKNQSNI